MCVNRFKIPSASVPLIRIYEGELLLGYDVATDLSLLEETFTGTPTDAIKLNMTDLFNVLGGFPASSYDSVRSKYYIDLVMHTEGRN